MPYRGQEFAAHLVGRELTYPRAVDAHFDDLAGTADQLLDDIMKSHVHPALALSAKERRQVVLSANEIRARVVPSVHGVRHVVVVLGDPTLFPRQGRQHLDDATAFASVIDDVSTKRFDRLPDETRSIRATARTRRWARSVARSVNGVPAAGSAFEQCRIY